MKALRSARAISGSRSDSGCVGGERSDREWCIRIGEVFDFDAALECLRQCREDRRCLPDSLRFDLTRTRLLSTAGIGVMLHIWSDYQLAPGHAVIEYQDPQVGEMLNLSGIQRAFRVHCRDASRHWPA